MSEAASNPVLQSEPKATGGILDSEPAAVGGILSSEPANTAGATPAASSSAPAPANTEPAATAGSSTPPPGQPSGSDAGGKEVRVSALPALERADKLHGLLQRIRAEASADLAGFYSVPALAIEGWLSTAIAAAEQLAAELRGDVVPPGGEHGGPAD